MKLKLHQLLSIIMSRDKLITVTVLKMMTQFLKEDISSRQVLTIVVSVMDPKLLMKILQVTFTGGPEGTRNRLNFTPFTSDGIYKHTLLFTPHIKGITHYNHTFKPPRPLISHFMTPSFITVWTERQDQERLLTVHLNIPVMMYFSWGLLKFAAFTPLIFKKLLQCNLKTFGKSTCFFFFLVGPVTSSAITGVKKERKENSFTKLKRFKRNSRGKRANIGIVKTKLKEGHRDMSAHILAQCQRKSSVCTHLPKLLFCDGIYIKHHPVRLSMWWNFLAKVFGNDYR